jgi:hypothetical protein
MPGTDIPGLSKAPRPAATKEGNEKAVGEPEEGNEKAVEELGGQRGSAFHGQ